MRFPTCGCDDKQSMEFNAGSPKALEQETAGEVRQETL